MNTNNEGTEGGDKAGEILRRVFVKMVEEKGVPEGEREGEVERLVELYETKVRHEVLGALSLDKLKEVEALLDKEEFGEGELEEIIKGAGVKFESVADKVIREIRKDYLGEVAEDMENEGVEESKWND